jgi:hypothetical protein
LLLPIPRFFKVINWLDWVIVIFDSRTCYYLIDRCPALIVEETNTAPLFHLHTIYYKQHNFYSIIWSMNGFNRITIVWHIWHIHSAPFCTFSPCPILRSEANSTNKIIVIIVIIITVARRNQSHS